MATVNIQPANLAAGTPCIQVRNADGYDLCRLAVIECPTCGAEAARVVQDPIEEGKHAYVTAEVVRAVGGSRLLRQYGTIDGLVATLAPTDPDVAAAAQSLWDLMISKIPT